MQNSFAYSHYPFNSRSNDSCFYTKITDSRLAYLVPLLEIRRFSQSKKVYKCLNMVVAHCLSTKQRWKSYGKCLFYRHDKQTCLVRLHAILYAEEKALKIHFPIKYKSQAWPGLKSNSGSIVSEANDPTTRPSESP